MPGYIAPSPLENWLIGAAVAQIAEAIRSLIAFDSIVSVDPVLLLRAVEVYETDRLDFAEAYLVACAESANVGRIASFDKAIDRVTTVERVEPLLSLRRAE